MTHIEHYYFFFLNSAFWITSKLISYSSFARKMRNTHISNIFNMPVIRFVCRTAGCSYNEQLVHFWFKQETMNLFVPQRPSMPCSCHGYVVSQLLPATTSESLNRVCRPNWRLAKCIWHGAYANYCLHYVACTYTRGLYDEVEIASSCR